MVFSIIEKVVNFEKDDKVCDLVAGGRYSEYCMLHKAIALSVSDLTYIETVDTTRKFFTVLTNVSKFVT